MPYGMRHVQRWCLPSTIDTPRCTTVNRTPAMLPFSISIRTGLPLYEQVVFAVTRAVVSGQIRAGDPFPSVRVLSQELKINPNTAHKIVAALVEQGLLVVRPGIGTVVAEGRPAGAAARRALLHDDLERLVIEARRAGITLDEVLTAIRKHWVKSERRAG
jgi:GntR family transcriptional regulator